VSSKRTKDTAKEDLSGKMDGSTKEAGYMANKVESDTTVTIMESKERVPGSTEKDKSG